MIKKCSIFNYIPHKTPFMEKKDDNFEEWYYKYEHELRAMYIQTLFIIKNDDYTDIVIDLDSERHFNIFVNFIYDSSSKYI